MSDNNSDGSDHKNGHSIIEMDPNFIDPLNLVEMNDKIPSLGEMHSNI